MRSLGERILVEPIAADERSAGGLYIPGAVPVPRGRIVAVGERLLAGGGTEPLPVRVGETLYYREEMGGIRVNGLASIPWQGVVAVEDPPADAEVEPAPV